MNGLPADSLTVLRSATGVLTKRICQNAGGWQVEAFSAGMHYSVRAVPVDSFAALAEALSALSRNPRCAVIRGTPLPGTDLRHCRRLLHPCPRTGDAPTFAPAPRRWLALDIDSLPEPAGMVFAAEPEAGVEHVLGLLPEPFADASCWWQCTGKAGVVQGIRLRLWFWLSRLLDDAEARGWLARCPVDRSILGAVALHYVAAPILEPGTPDPVARRSGIRRGLDDVVEVPDALPRLEPLFGEAVPIELRELSDDELAQLRHAMLGSPLAAAIWTGARAYPDRSRRHFAFGCELARMGVRDRDALAAALVALDEHAEADLSKVNRPDYLARTVGSILASVEAGQ